MKNRRHHFVPKFLLKWFSKDGRRVGTLVLRTGVFIRDASIKEQCSRGYYYGIDGSVEKALSDLEGAASQLLRRFVCGDELEMSDGDQLLLLHFLIFQRFRTPGAEQNAESFMGALVKEIALADGEFSESDFDGIRLRVANMPVDNLMRASELAPIWSDLEVKILLNDHSHKFMLADDPVALTNQYAMFDVTYNIIPGLTGLGVQGLQVFLPISPSHCLALFDPNTYEYGGRESNHVRVSKNDVSLLNELQVANARDCVYVDSDGMPDEEIDSIVRVHKNAKESRSAQSSTSPHRSDGKNKSAIIAVTSRTYRLPRKMSFVRCIRANTRKGTPVPGAVPLRSEHLAEFTTRYGDFLQERIEHMRGILEKEKENT